MNIYNFMNQKYREWKKSGKSSIIFPQIRCEATNSLRDKNYTFLKDTKIIDKIDIKENII